MNVDTFRINMFSYWKTSKTDAQLANLIELAIKDLVSSGVVATIDVGEGITPEGTYAGESSRAGAMVMKSGLGIELLQAWQKFYPVEINGEWRFSDPAHSPFSEGPRIFCEDFARITAKYIDESSISTTTIGLITVPADPPYTEPASADATGEFTGEIGAQNTIASSLLAVFKKIEEKSSGMIPPLDSDSLIQMCVNSLAVTIPAYISSGTVDIEYSNAQIRGTGSGSVS